MVVSQIFCTFIGDLQQVTNIFDMTTDYKVTELFCIIDEFCKHFDAENAGNLLEDNSGVKRRRRAASLSDSEIMTILFNLFRFFIYSPCLMAWEENSCICLHMQLIAILSRIGVLKCKQSWTMQYTRMYQVWECKINCVRL